MLRKKIGKCREKKTTFGQTPTPFMSRLIKNKVLIIAGSRLEMRLQPECTFYLPPSWDTRDTAYTSFQNTLFILGSEVGMQHGVCMYVMDQVMAETTT